MIIKQIRDNKKQFLDLLLLGDEQENMIDRYLADGDMFALYDDDLKAICVVTRVDNSTCELKNIAVYTQYWGQGYGSALIKHICDYYKVQYKAMLVGTGESPSILKFYKYCGFEYSHRVENFFTDNYDLPIFEDGIQLVDMVYLKKELHMKKITLRKALIEDIPKLNKLYKDTVLTINKKDYTLDEVEDWASCADDMERWHKLLDEQHYVVAECEGLIVGFGSINDDGYMHTLFVHKDYQGQGIASLLYQYLDKYANERGAKKITSEVSITAKPFFEKQGFQVDEEQKRKANRLYLINYKMSKCLDPSNGKTSDKKI